MPFGRGATQRVNRRTSAATRVSATRRMSAARAKANSPQNERGSAPARGTLRENQNQIAISLVNKKLDTLLNLLHVEDNSNTITTLEQLNVRLDNLIKTIKESRESKRREEDRAKHAYGISKNIEHGAYM
jgi:hypothetical protein